MMKKLKNTSGLLLVAFIFSIVLMGMVITTAFLNFETLETARRDRETAAKMDIIKAEVGGADFKIIGETGGDLTFLNYNNRFPTNMGDFLGPGFLKNHAFTSGFFSADMDYYGNSYTLADGAPFTISTSAAPADETIDGDYDSNTVFIEIKDFDGSDLTEGYFDIGAIGIYNIGTTSRHSQLTWTADGEYQSTSDLAVGKYEIRLVGSDLIDSGWMQTAYPDNEVRIPLFVHFDDSANIRTKYIRIPADPL